MEITVKEFRNMRKKAGVCRDCGQEDAYTMNGRTYCFDCAEKQRLHKAELRRDVNERLKQSEIQKQVRQKRKEQGLCTRCGKVNNTTYSTCDYCRNSMRENRKRKLMLQGNRTWEERTSGDTCFFCGEKTVEGKKLCKNCMAKRINTLIEANPNMNYRKIDSYL